MQVLIPELHPLPTLDRAGMAVAALVQSPFSSVRQILQYLDSTEAHRPGAFDQFMDAARRCLSLKHPRIVRHVELGVFDDGRPYLKTEPLEGVTLRTHLDRFGRLELEDLVQLGLAMLEGLAYAHRSGVVHGALRPESVFFEGGVLARMPKLILFALPPSTCAPQDDLRSLARTLFTAAGGDPFTVDGSPELSALPGRAQSLAPFFQHALRKEGFLNVGQMASALVDGAVGAQNVWASLGNGGATTTVDLPPPPPSPPPPAAPRTRPALREAQQARPKPDPLWDEFFGQGPMFQGDPDEDTQPLRVPRHRLRGVVAATLLFALVAGGGAQLFFPGGVKGVVEQARARWAALGVGSPTAP